MSDLTSPVLRRLGAQPSCEERSFEVRGQSLVSHRWTYGGGWIRRDLVSRTKRFPSAAAARDALAEEVAKLGAAGWGELPAWPELPEGWYAARAPASAPAPRAEKGAKKKSAKSAKKKPPRVEVGRVRAVGPVAKVDPERLDALGAAFGTTVPRSWRALLGRLGPGTFAGRLRVSSPERAIRETRAFRRSYRDQYRVFFTNHDAVIGDDATKLVLLASSIEGDQVGFLAGAPQRLFVLPRNRTAIEVVDGFAEVLGRFAAIAREADGAAPTYAPAVK